MDVTTLLLAENRIQLDRDGGALYGQKLPSGGMQLHHLHAGKWRIVDPVTADVDMDYLLSPSGDQIFAYGSRGVAVDSTSSLPQKREFWLAHMGFGDSIWHPVRLDTIETPGFYPEEGWDWEVISWDPADSNRIYLRKRLRGQFDLYAVQLWSYHLSRRSFSALRAEAHEFFACSPDGSSFLAQSNGSQNSCVWFYSGDGLRDIWKVFDEYARFADEGLEENHYATSGGISPDNKWVALSIYNYRGWDRTKNRRATAGSEPDSVSKWEQVEFCSVGRYASWDVEGATFVGWVGPFSALLKEPSVVPEPPVWAEAHNNWQMHPGKYFVIDIRNRTRSYPFSYPVKIIAVAWGPAEH